MEQEASGLPSQASNPSGIGAVYLGKDTDLLGIHLDNLKNFDATQRQREAAKVAQKQQALNMFADLKYNPDGILPNHTPYFRERADKLFGDFANIQGRFGGNTGSPEYLQALSKWNVDKQKFETDLAGSKTMNQKLQTAATKYDPDKIDRSHVQNMALQRVQSPEDLFDKGQIAELDNKLPLFTPKKVQVLDIARNAMNQTPPSISSKAIKDEFGRVGTVETKTYTQQQLDGMAFSGYNAGGEAAEDINYAFDNLDEFTRASYIEQANRLSTPNKAVAPQQLYYKSILEGENSVQQQREQFGYSPMDSEAAKYQYKNKDEVNSVAWDADRLDNFFSDNDTVWGKPVPDTEGNTIDQSTPSKVDMYKPVAQYTDLIRRKIGTATIPVYEKKPDGTIRTTTDANGNKVPIVQSYTTIPNEIMYGKKVGEKRYVQTTEAMARVASGFPNATGWQEVTPTELADMMSLGQTNPTKYRGMMLNEFEGRKQYKQKEVEMQQNKQAQKQQPKAITSKAEFDALPKGAQFIRNGKLYTKQ